MIRAIALMSVILGFTAPAVAQDLAVWKEILSFRPATEAQRSIHARGEEWVVHRIEDASGQVNLDYYPIRVTKLPKVDGRLLSAAELLEYVRLHLNEFVDTELTEFEPFAEQDAAKWNSSDPNGALLLLEIKLTQRLTDRALVLTSQSSPNEWRFSTVRGGTGYPAVGEGNNPGAHPVSGNRAFGFFGKNETGWTFYTIGADRATRPLDEFWGIPGAREIGFEMGDRLWRSFQTKLRDFVNAHEGEAAVAENATVSSRHDWEQIKSNPDVYETSRQPEWVRLP